MRNLKRPLVVVDDVPLRYKDLEIREGWLYVTLRGGVGHGWGMRLVTQAWRRSGRKVYYVRSVERYMAGFGNLRI